MHLRHFGGWISADPSSETPETAIEESVADPSFEPVVTPVTLTASSVQSEGRPTVSPVQTGRYLRIENNTAEPLKIRIQYASDNGTWQWLTGSEGADRRFERDLQAGKDIDLSLETNRVRIWAESSSGLSYKDWSLPEVGDPSLLLLLRLES
jgi:hypothetical protein